MYKPREDSFLLEKYVKRLAKGRVLDLGTGTGIQAIAAAKSRKVSEVVAADIDKEVVCQCRLNINNKRIQFIVSDLFRNVKEKFDTIIFNPPYLPQDKNIDDSALYGGKKGFEIIARFFSKVNRYLNKNGIILIVFSSLTDKTKVDKIIKKSGFKFKELEKQHIFFEDLYVYLIK